MPELKREISEAELMKTPEIKRLIKKITVECLWLHVLSLLTVKPYYAYELKEEIKKAFGFSPSRITVYKVLYLLKRRDYVKIRKREVKGRERKYYVITKKGRKLLLKGKETLEEIANKLLY